VSEADAARVRAETRCRLLFECCDPVYQFDTETACVAHFQAYYQGVHDEARAAGLTYDPECLGFDVAGENAFGCGQGPYQEWCVNSDIYRGNVGEGEACTSNIAGYFNNCQAKRASPSSALSARTAKATPACRRCPRARDARS
jgi:hypothetical protein